jgi:DNA replication protein DnaC
MNTHDHEVTEFSSSEALPQIEIAFAGTILRSLLERYLSVPNGETVREAFPDGIAEFIGTDPMKWRTVAFPKQPEYNCCRCYDDDFPHSQMETEDGIWFLIKENDQPRCSCWDSPREVLAGIAGGIPQRFEHFRVSALEPSEASQAKVEDQAKWISALQESPTGNFIMCGPPGVGKSTYAAALLIDASWRCNSSTRSKYERLPSIWRVSAYELVRRHQEVMIYNGPSKECPSEMLTEALIKQAKAAGYRPVLCVEEIDKIRSSESASLFVTSLINTVHEADGQIIATTNLRPLALVKHLGSEAIWRRLAGGDSKFGGLVLDMFKGAS